MSSVDGTTVLCLAVLVALGAASAWAGSGKYESCTIANGEVFSCTGWYQGKAVVINPASGKYESCTIANGEVFSCTGWYQGKAAVINPASGKYESCTIANGDVFSCTGWYQGKAVARS
jgi:hypothetical protein